MTAFAETLIDFIISSYYYDDILIILHVDFMSMTKRDFVPVCGISNDK